MNADITLTQIYYNSGLRDFFFRNQATDTLREIIEDRASEYGMTSEEILDRMHDYCEDCAMSLDDLEEVLYSWSTKSIIEDFFGFEPSSDDDDESEE